MLPFESTRSGTSKRSSRGISGSPRWDENAPNVQAFIERYRKRWNREPDLYGPYFYDAVKMYAAAIDKVGTDGTAIRDYLVGLKDFPSAMGGRFGMGPDRQTVMAINLWRVKGGELTKILPGQK